MKKLVLSAALMLALVACKSAEERAADHYEKALEFHAEGETQSALVELRNALLRDPSLRDARLLFADLLLEQGRERDAFHQFVQIIEANPEDLEANRALARIAFDSFAWTEAEKYARAAAAIDGDDEGTQSILVALDYRQADIDRDATGLQDAESRATALIAANPDLLRARRVLVAAAIRADDPEQAMVHVEAGLETDPEDRDLHFARLAVLNRLGQIDDLEAQLLAMVDLFADDPTVERLLLEFYVQQGNPGAALTHLRDKIDPDSEEAEARVVYLRVLSNLESDEAMRAELTQMLEQNPLPGDIAANEMAFRALKAGVDFTLGDREPAMIALEALIDGVEPDEQVDNIKVQLAQMRLAVGNNVGARTLVEQVLEHDTGHVEALKMRGAWLIEEDKTTEAIRALREALANAPQDAQAISLLASVYEREGRTELMAEMLARAVEVSEQGEGESLRYASYLARQDELVSAEGVLISALERRPNSLQLLGALANVHLAMQDWGRAAQDVQAIRQRIQTPEGELVANELQAQILSQRDQQEDLNNFLTDLAAESDGQTGPQIALIRNMLRSGDVEGATAAADRLSESHPDAPEVRLLAAQMIGVNGDGETALAEIVALNDEFPEFLTAWTTRYAILLRSGQRDEAFEVLRAARAALPQNGDLAMAEAGHLERDGNVEAAIQVYRDLYAENSGNLIVANNLASLISTYYTDEENLEQAWIYARRLRGAQVPAFQDTYGWIAFRRGEEVEALNALEFAVEGLPNDPAVNYHYGRALQSQGRSIAAKAAYDLALELIANGAFAHEGLEAEITRALAELGN